MKSPSLLFCAALPVYRLSLFLSPQPTHWWIEEGIWEMESGFLVAVPRPGSWHLFPDLCPSRNRRNGMCKKSVGESTGSWVCQQRGGRQAPVMPHLCSTDVTWAAGGQSSEAAGTGQRLHWSLSDMVAGMQEIMTLV